MLRLRPYKPCDAAQIVSWIGDERSFRQWCADRFPVYPITADDLRRHYDAFGSTDNFFPMTAFDETGPAGHLILRFTDENKSTLRFGFVIVDDRKRGRGYGREMLALALRFAFEILRVDRVTLGVFENNPAAYRCYRAAGFQDAPLAPPEQYRIFGETWRCLELKMDKEAWLSARPW